MFNSDDYAQALFRFLPPGKCFNNKPGSNLSLLLEALGKELARLSDRALDLISESNPVTAVELLPVRYDEANLPANCSGVPAETLQQMRSEILACWQSTGGATKAYLLDFLTRIGLQVSIDEFYISNPLATCVSTCTASMFDVNYLGVFRVNYVDTSQTDFVAGGSVCGESLGTFSSAAEFDCLIKRLKPAHTEVILNPVTSL